MVDEESNLLQGSVFQNQMKHKATHFFTPEEQNASTSYFNRGMCAAGLSHSLNILLGIVALIPWITVTFNGHAAPRCVPDFGKWIFLFGIVALACPLLHGFFARFEDTQGRAFVGDGSRKSRPFYEWICIFGGALVVAFNWIFNLGWALLALPSFVSHRFYDSTLSTWCQREHDIGVVIIITILSSIAIVLLCSCLFSIRFLDVLIRNWYRRRGADDEES